MTDDCLKNYVLRRADDDPDLTDDARLVVLAALGDPDDLAHVLGSDATSPELVDALTTPDDTAAEPVGAYLKSISVQGFRGIGPKVTLPLPPGPGLVVVAGRNGSGKSTLAEALELALTETSSRWEDKAAQRSSNSNNPAGPPPVCSTTRSRSPSTKRFPMTSKTPRSRSCVAKPSRPLPGRCSRQKRWPADVLATRSRTPGRRLRR